MKQLIISSLKRFDHKKDSYKMVTTSINEKASCKLKKQKNKLIKV